MKTLTLLAVLGLFAAGALSLTACKDNTANDKATPTTDPTDEAPGDTNATDGTPVDGAGDGKSCGGKGSDSKGSDGGAGES